MPRLTEATRQARRAHIIEAAIRCFSAKGFIGTSMADIIEESGMSSGSIYSHFKGKDEILHAAIDQRLTELEQVVTSAEGVSPQLLFTTVCATHLPSIQPSTILRLWTEIGLQRGKSEFLLSILTRVRGIMADSLLPWASDHHPPGITPEEYAQVMADNTLTILHGFVLRGIIDPHLNTETYRAQLTALLPS